MTLFRSFTAPLWEIFAGNLLLLVCSLLYLAWWVLSFRPNSSGAPAGVFSLAAACVTGIAAIALMSYGIGALSQDAGGVPVKWILIGASALFIILLLVTSIALRRMVTSELLILHVWAAIELSAVAVLYGTGRFGAGRAAGLAALVGIAAVIGLICYALYYRLDEPARFQAGMVPLAAAASVMALFLATQAVS